jgi:hypothetical protein
MGASIETSSSLCHSAFIPYLEIAFFHLAGSSSSPLVMQPEVLQFCSTFFSLTGIVQQFSSKSNLRRIMQQPFEGVNLLCGCAS